MEQMREKMKQEAIVATTQQTTKGKESGEQQSDDWTEDQTQLLIKAVNLFPAGTASRYSKNTLRCIIYTASCLCLDCRESESSMEEGEKTEKRLRTASARSCFVYLLWACYSSQRCVTY